MPIEIAKREPCPECIKKGLDTDGDNLAIYANGKFCQSCGYSDKAKKVSPLIPGSLVEISERGLTLKTCEHYNVRTKSFTGRLANNELFDHLVVVFPLYESGKVIRQKIRSKSDKKIMAQRGDMSCKRLFGQQCFSPTKKLPVIITEGEYDAMAVYQMTGLPAVSILNGSNGAQTDILNNLEWLSQWREVLICFDMDEAGRKAVSDSIGVFEPGTARSVILSNKDANEMLLENKVDEFKKCLSTAEIIRPKTIVSLSEIRHEILKQPEYGMPWPWPFMDKITYGCRLGETYMLAGPESVGKTQFMYQVLSNFLNTGYKVGFFDLERDNAQSSQRFIGNMHGKIFYRPGSKDWDVDLLDTEINRLDDKIKLYRPESGKLTLESVLINIRYMNKAFGITVFILDNLTKLNLFRSGGITESEFASLATGHLCQIGTELHVTIFILNHPTKSPVNLNADITLGEDFIYNTNKEGLTWETGRMMESNHVYGGGNVVKLPDYVIVFARNRMSKDDIIKRTLLVKFIKTRFESDYEGHVQKLIFSRETSRLDQEY